MRKVMMFAIVVLAVSCGKFTYGGAENDATCVNTAIESTDEAVYKIIASRMVNSLHYVWEADELSHSLSCGEYYLTAFHAQEGLYEIEGLDDFTNDVSVSMQDVYATVPCVDEDTQDRLAAFNPYASFVAPADGLLMCAFRKVSLRDSAQVVTFSPRSLTQNLVFRLKIRQMDGVRITGVRAAVSGVAARARLMSGMIRNDAENPTYRQYVGMSQTSANGDLLEYEGFAPVLGLFPPSSDEYVSGPGIFQVEVVATVSDGGKDVTKVFYAGINMKSVIEKAGLMEEAKDRSGFRIIKQDAVLLVPTVLEVGRDQVVSSEGEGLEKWFVNDADIEVEI